MIAVNPNIEELYAKNKNLRKQDIQALREWLKLQPHLPEIKEYMLILFLHSCNYSLEGAKKCIDNYYTVKTMCPEVFAKRSPISSEMQNNMNVVMLTPLPKPTPDGYSIFYSRLQDFDPDKYNFNMVLKQYDMAVSLHLQETGTSAGHIAIIDCTGFTLSHAMKLNLTTIKKYMFFLQEAIPFRLCGIHYVNCVPFLDTVIAVFKPFMKKELLDRLQIHLGNNETIYNTISKDLLPEEVGGSLGPLKKINDEYVEKMKQNMKFFLEEEKLVADESKCTGKPRSESEMFGVEGSFKKLDID